MSILPMKHLLITTIAAVLVVGCGPSVEFWEAARTGNIEAVKQHIAAGTDVNVKGYKEQTPLHFSAFWGLKEITELLIAAGADVNAKNDEGKTPLDRAKYKRETAAILRKHGGNTGEELKAEGK